jgi:hypothetical protein
MRSPAEALRCFSNRLEEIVDLGEIATYGQHLESYGRWCICAAEVAYRYLSEEESLRPLGVFLGKARDIADRSQNWSLYERVFALEFLRRKRMAGHPDIEWNTVSSDDREEMQTLLGVMSRFPHFRQTGWHIANAILKQTA